MQYSYVNGQHNELTPEKIAYIRAMRADLVNEDMLHKNTGLLNLEYFNVKKGSYWSPKHTQKLKEHVCAYGAFNSQFCVYSVMRRHKFLRQEADLSYKSSPDKITVNEMVKTAGSTAKMARPRKYVRLFKPFEKVEI